MGDIQKLIEYAIVNNSFYRSIAQAKELSNICDFSILNRDIIQEHQEKFLSDQYRGKAFNDLKKSTTSGSSGRPIWIYWDKDQYLKSMSALWRRRYRYYGITPLSKQINFSLNIYNDFREQNDSIIYKCYSNQISINKGSICNEKNLQELYTLMVSNRFEWIYGQPAILDLLADHIITHDLEPIRHCLYIEVVGEVFTKTMKKKMAACFPNARIANMYGSEEMNAIAYECPCGRMHVISENVMAECFDGQEIHLVGEGEAILTNIHNYAMPLIRYNQGDIIKLSSPISCSCGYTDAIIEQIKGRVRDSFLYSGSIITTYFLSESIEIVNNELNNPIYGYKFVYHKGKKHLEVYININPKFNEWKEVVEKEVRRQLSRKFQDADINVLFTKDVVPFARDKFKILSIL